MNAWDIHVGDVIEKKPFWGKPMRVLWVWEDDGYYADVEYADSGAQVCLPMQLSCYRSGGVLHREISKVIRDGVEIYAAPLPEDHAQEEGA